MPQLYACPYNIGAIGFYFKTEEEYEEKVETCFDHWGNPIEEFEIEFIDGERIDLKLFSAWKVHQSNVGAYLKAVEDLKNYEKIALIALAECGYSIDEDTNIDDVLIYYCDSLKDLAIQFVEEGLYGEIEDYIKPYINYDAIAQDLAMEYTELQIAGETVIYRCP